MLKNWKKHVKNIEKSPDISKNRKKSSKMLKNLEKTVKICKNPETTVEKVQKKGKNRQKY